MRHRIPILILLCLPLHGYVAEPPLILFDENAVARGITFVQTNGARQKEYIYEAKGAGLAVADVDRDGWDDIYFVNGTDPNHTGDEAPPRNQLYRNRGDGTFEDITEASGLGDTGFGTSAVFADYDGDGDLDCLVANYGPNVLYRNNGAGHFTDVTAESGIGSGVWNTGASFGDLDRDGDLDLYICAYAYCTPEIARKRGKMSGFYGMQAFIGPSSYEPEPDRLLINHSGVFSDETKQRGINQEGCGRGFTPILTDMDNDGDLDIYVSNDSTPNHLYLNDGHGKFEEMGLLMGVAVDGNGKSQGSMGVAIADYDGNQSLDVFVNNYEHEKSLLYSNEGEFGFDDVGTSSGASSGTVMRVSFGALGEDLDNDMWPDLFIANGHVYPVADEITQCDGYAQPAQVLRNMGDGKFTDVSESCGPAFQRRSIGRGAAAGDFDRDGDVDIVVGNLDGRPFFFENRSPKRNYFQLALQNERGMPAVGARVWLTAGEFTMVRELYTGNSFLSQNSEVLHFGLGGQEQVDRLKIRWPDGSERTMERLPANQRLVVRK